PSIRSTYGDLRPVRAVTSGAINRTFVYPRNHSDPSAQAMRDSFKITSNDFDSVICNVQGNIYVGRTSAGGEGSSIDIDGDGRADVSFNRPCAFVLQLLERKIVAMETDRVVHATLAT